MRITKVKITIDDKKTEMMMKRDHEKGSLNAEAGLNAGSTKDILNLKEGEFIKSFSHKVVVYIKESTNKRSEASKSLASIFEAAISGNKKFGFSEKLENFFKSFSDNGSQKTYNEAELKEKIKEIINPKFSNLTKDKFNIIDIVASLHNMRCNDKILEVLKPFTDWSKRRLRGRKKNLKNR